MTPDIPPLVGFTGLAGSGKSTAANWILRNHANPIKVPFAGPLKKMLYELLRDALPATWHIKAREYIEDPVLKNEPIPFLGGYSARRLMQTLGTEWGRKAVHEDFWVGIAASKVERIMGTPQKRGPNTPLKVVFDDVRFANEAMMIRAYDGVVVRVVRPGIAPVEDHDSETLDFEADIVLDNSGTEEDLHAQLAALFPPPPRVETKTEAKAKARAKAKSEAKSEAQSED